MYKHRYINVFYIKEIKHNKIRQRLQQHTKTEKVLKKHLILRNSLKQNLIKLQKTQKQLSNNEKIVMGIFEYT